MKKVFSGYINDTDLKKVKEELDVSKEKNPFADVMTEAPTETNTHKLTVTFEVEE